MTEIKGALLYAAWNAAYSTAVLATGGIVAATLDLLDGTGPRWVAVFFALLGGLWRWHKFQLSPSAAVSGMALSSMLAFIYGDTELPVLQSLLGNMRPESIPMLNGLLIGLFGLLLVTVGQDFINAYRKRGGQS